MQIFTKLKWKNTPWLKFIFRKKLVLEATLLYLFTLGDLFLLRDSMPAKLGNYPSRLLFQRGI